MSQTMKRIKLSPLPKSQNRDIKSGSSTSKNIKNKEKYENKSRRVKSVDFSTNITCKKSSNILFGVNSLATADTLSTPKSSYYRGETGNYEAKRLILRRKTELCAPGRMANYIIEDINPNLSKVLSNKEDSIQNSFSKKPMIVMCIKEANRLLNIESIQTPNKLRKYDETCPSIEDKSKTLTVESSLANETDDDLYDIEENEFSRCITSCSMKNNILTMMEKQITIKSINQIENSIKQNTNTRADTPVLNNQNISDYVFKQSLSDDSYVKIHDFCIPKEDSFSEMTLFLASQLEESKDDMSLEDLLRKADEISSFCSNIEFNQ